MRLATLVRQSHDPTPNPSPAEVGYIRLRPPIKLPASGKPHAECAALFGINRGGTRLVILVIVKEAGDLLSQFD